jgi:hypothetical protein
MKNNKWLAITCSRDDGDFIESFIRGNSRYIDKFVIVDDSTDNTCEILRNLRKEGFDIEIIRKKGIVSDQKAKTNWMFQKYGNPSKFSAVIPLDVDEVIIPRSPTDNKDNVRIDSFPTFLDWIPFAPVSLGWPLADDGLAESFTPTMNEIGRVKKVFLPRASFTDRGVIEIGAHNYHVDGEPSVLGVNNQLALAHFPIRSVEQLVSKLATKVVEVRLKKAKAPGEALHYTELVKMIIRTDFSPSLHDLQSAAANYSNYSDKSGSPMDTAISVNPPISYSVSLPPVRLVYNDLARVNLIRNLYQLSSELTDQLVTEFAIRPKIDRHYRVPFRKQK